MKISSSKHAMVVLSTVSWIMLLLLHQIILSHSLETGITHLANYVILNSCLANTSVVEIGFCNTLA